MIDEIPRIGMNESVVPRKSALIWNMRLWLMNHFGKGVSKYNDDEIVGLYRIEQYIHQNPTFDYEKHKAWYVKRQLGQALFGDLK